MKAITQTAVLLALTLAITGMAAASPSPLDLNGDEVVNCSDFDCWQNDWWEYQINHQYTIRSDFNNDQVIDEKDYSVIHFWIMSVEVNSGNVPGDLNGNGIKNDPVDIEWYAHYIRMCMGGQLEDMLTGELFFTFCDIDSDGVITQRDANIASVIC